MLIIIHIKDLAPIILLEFDLKWIFMCLFSDILIMSFFQVQNLLQQMVSEYLLFLFFWYFIVIPFF